MSTQENNNIVSFENVVWILQKAIKDGCTFDIKLPTNKKYIKNVEISLGYNITNNYKFLEYITEEDGCTGEGGMDDWIYAMMNNGELLFVSKGRKTITRLAINKATKVPADSFLKNNS